jgi:uncharacterized protein
MTKGDGMQHREDGGKGEFFVEREGKRVAELTYSLKDGDMVAEHTWVDPAARGGTLAASLVQALAGHARGQGRKVVAVCPYVAKVFGRSPEYADIRKP